MNRATAAGEGVSSLSANPTRGTTTESERASSSGYLGPVSWIPAVSVREPAGADAGRRRPAMVCASAALAGGLGVEALALHDAPSGELALVAARVGPAAPDAWEQRE